MTKILVLSDDGVPSGYGRISMEVNTRLATRGYDIMAASIQYDGLLPPMHNGARLPYWVASLGGHQDWAVRFMGLVNSYQPDIIAVMQDAPYSEQVRALPLDWSRYALLIVSPVDGTPILPRWLDLFKKADGVMSISEFGVEAHRKGGVESHLLRPGVNLNELYPITAQRKSELRAQAGIPDDAFVLITVAQNQGRKDYPAMLKGFFEFASGRNTYYIINAEKESPAGWSIPDLCQQNGWDQSKLIYRDDLVRKGIHDLKDRYGMADVHAVLSHREGFGLPHVEAQACGIVTMTIDYCSGHEIACDGKGVFVDVMRSVNGEALTSASTWGGALDYFADPHDFAKKLEWMYTSPHERAVIADKGKQWARSTCTWDAAADAVQRVIDRVIEKRKSIPHRDIPMVQLKQPEPVKVPSPDGLTTEPVKELALVEAGK